MVGDNSPRKNKGKEFNFKKDYRLVDFVNSHPKANRKFIEKFTETSHFIHFLYRQYDSSKNSYKTAIDKALEIQKNHKSPVK